MLLTAEIAPLFRRRSFMARPTPPFSHWLQLGAQKKKRSSAAIEEVHLLHRALCGIFAFCVVSFFFSGFLVILPEGTQTCCFAIPAMRIHALVFHFWLVTVCRGSLALPSTNQKNFNLLSIFMATHLPYQLTTILRPFVWTLWYDVSWRQYTLSTALNVLPRPHLSQASRYQTVMALMLYPMALKKKTPLTEAELAASALQPRRASADPESISELNSPRSAAPRNNVLLTKTWRERSSDSKIFAINMTVAERPPTAQQCLLDG